MEFKMILDLKIIIFIVLLVILTSGCTTIVPQNYEGLIETLG
ncbi:MAG: SPFH domain-containing protein, partial [Lactobacillus iners]|nr:SPFH domain-containing protein [Lactobacillus iners]